MVSNHKSVSMGVRSPTEIDRFEACLPEPVPGMIRPMGSIPKDAPDTCTGICIKCHACIKACPAGAKYFDDEAFLSHVEMLKQNYQRRAEAEWFI